MADATETVQRDAMQNDECTGEERITRYTICHVPTPPPRDNLTVPHMPWLHAHASYEASLAEHVDIPSELHGEYIGIDGAISSGKSEFCAKIVDKFNDANVPVHAFLEDAHHRVLPKFTQLLKTAKTSQAIAHSGVPGGLQIHMHAHAYQRRTFGQDAVARGITVFQDRTERGNFAFATANHEAGNFLEPLWEFFCSCVEQPWYQGIGACVFFDVSVETVFERIARRGIEAESDYDRPYLDRLNRHDYWILLDNAMQQRPHPLVVVPWDYDYISAQPVVDLLATALRRRNSGVGGTPRVHLHDATSSIHTHAVLFDAVHLTRADVGDIYAMRRAPYPRPRGAWARTHLDDVGGRAQLAFVVDLQHALAVDDEEVRRAVTYLMARPDTLEIHIKNARASPHPRPPLNP